MLKMQFYTKLFDLFAEQAVDHPLAAMVTTAMVRAQPAFTAMHAIPCDIGYIHHT